jgi:hypothetical protein
LLPAGTVRKCRNSRVSLERLTYFLSLATSYQEVMKCNSIVLVVVVVLLLGFSTAERERDDDDDEDDLEE